jgi:hypothetical protein
VITSGTDFRLPALATFISAITVAPATGIAAGATAVVLPLAPSAVAGYATATGISYDITVSLTTGAGSTRPFAVVTLAWFNSDDPAAQAVALQSWVLPAGATGTTGTIITGTGPQRGQYWQITVTNTDTVNMAITVQANATGRAVARDSWIWDAFSSVAVPGYTLPPGGGAYGNSLGAISALNIAHSASVSYLMGLFAGEVWFRANNEGGTAGQIEFTLTPQPASVWGTASLINESPAGEFGTLMVLPRGPCLLTLNNQDTTNAHKADAEIIAYN